ncbi:alpha/beta hydrolase, partial [Leptospira venezuelensis]
MKIVLLHGMWSRPDTLDSVRKVLEEKGHEVFAPTLPFHVLNKPPDPALGKYRLVDYVEFLKKEIQNKGWN